MLIYIAGPMTTSGEPGPNVHQACLAAREILRRGHAVVLPQINWFCDAVAPTEMEWWWSHNVQMLERSDALLRLPGPSAGADNEARYFSQFHGPSHPIFTTLTDLLACTPDAKPKTL